MRYTRQLLAAIGISAALSANAVAQAKSNKSSFDRTVLPKAGVDPVAKIPTWIKSTLSNGAQLVVVERHSLPLISFTMNLVGGAN